jgi:hypothetical protein
MILRTDGTSVSPPDAIAAISHAFKKSFVHLLDNL